MKKCACGNQVANNARTCPKCGHRFTSGLVKFLAWFFGIAVGLGMLGAIIGGRSDGPKQPPVSSTSQPASAASYVLPTEIKLGWLTADF
jgi:hypothetical protein